MLPAATYGHSIIPCRSAHRRSYTTQAEPAAGIFGQALRYRRWSHGTGPGQMMVGDSTIGGSLRLCPQPGGSEELHPGMVTFFVRVKRAANSEDNGKQAVVANQIVRKLHWQSMRGVICSHSQRWIDSLTLATTIPAKQPQRWVGASSGESKQQRPRFLHREDEQF